MSTTKVTVLMSVYNDERFLCQSIESILNQSFSDFDFLIIDDASTDSTPTMLHGYARRDNRINVITNETNIGLTASLNKGLNIATGKYIARIDSDDISLPYRLERQVIFLDKHPEIGVLGTGAEIIDDDGNVTDRFYPSTSPAVIRWRLLFGNYMLHSTVMFRRDIVLQIGGYPIDCFIAQDYDLWSQLMFQTDICQIPDILIQYRQHTNAISLTSHNRQAETSIKVVQKNLTKFFNIKLEDEIVKALCDSYNVRHNFPINSETVIDTAGRLYLDFRERYFQMVNLIKSEREMIDEDVVGKLLRLSRANARIFPFESIKLLKKALYFKRASLIQGSFWISLLKILLNSKKLIMRYWIGNLSKTKTNKGSLFF